MLTLFPHRNTHVLIFSFSFHISPKNKFVRVTHDDFYSSDIHQLTSAPARSQQVCAYDMDDIDLAWLNRVNNQRNAIGKYSMLAIGCYHTFSFLMKL